ncbi:MAG: MacB family efflux pump subunit [Pseudomonadota bacterium]
MILMQLENITKSYHSDAGSVHALRNINLKIHAGEMIAIVGTSGSGKSTLMNILGCIDRPSTGTYTVANYNSQTLNDDEISKLRREYFGFIFQSYHLLPNLNAITNVELPAFYAGIEENIRNQRAHELLKRMGLAERGNHFPSQLSGGQQQRVSIARALMNGGTIILADEPTGALDSHSGHEVLEMLRRLQQKGHTIIIITHDNNVAESTDRIIQLRDGEIILDTKKVLLNNNHPDSPQLGLSPDIKKKASLSLNEHLLNATKTALHALKANTLRSLLTVLGIVIGIASVVSIVAVGQGMRDSVLKSFRDIANLSLIIYPGSEAGDDKAGSIQSLVISDIDALAQHPYVEYVAPQVESGERLRYGRNDAAGQVTGINVGGFKKDGGLLVDGRDFNQNDIKDKAQVVLISDLAYRKLFLPGKKPIGEFVLVGRLPCRVIGVVSNQGSASMRGETVNVWLPYSTAALRLIGKPYFNSIAVRTRKDIASAQGEKIITSLLEKKHGVKDFYIYNNHQAFASLDSTTFTLTIGLGSVAAISLLVGGIGVMNIMLVSVSERIREIGIRRAIGARKQDILTQFLVESIFLCIVGGLIGIGLGAVACKGISLFSSIQASLSLISIIVAFTTCIVIGISFGVIPARRAAQLDPSLALSRE